MTTTLAEAIDLISSASDADLQQEIKKLEAEVAEKQRLIRKLQGFLPKQPASQAKGFSSEQKAEISRLIASGLTPEAIAEKMNLPIGSVRRSYGHLSKQAA